VAVQREDNDDDVDGVDDDVDVNEENHPNKQRLAYKRQHQHQQKNIETTIINTTHTYYTYVCSNAQVTLN